jgi:hypothetical protein
MKGTYEIVSVLSDISDPWQLTYQLQLVTCVWNRLQLDILTSRRL